MCRWFAYISTSEDCLLEDVLVSKSSPNIFKLLYDINAHTLPPPAPAHSLAKQIHEHYLPKLLSHDPADHAEHTTEAEITTRNRLFNVDGFGMVWYTPSQSFFSASHSSDSLNAKSGPILHPALYKTIQPPLHDANFRSICAATASPCVLAHVRAATSTAVTPVNNHPFVFGRHAIMHNGYISSFPKVSRQMYGLMSDEAYENIRGSTDTEALAALYISYLTAGAGEGQGAEKWEHTFTTKQMLEALQHTVNTIIDLQQKALGNQAEPNDLNVCVTDGRQLVALRFRNHATEQPPSLYYSTSAGVTLNRKYPDHPDGENGPDGVAKRGEKGGGHNPRAHRDAADHGRHFIVASEPTTYKTKEWDLIEKNHAVLVEADARFVVEKITYSGQK